MSKLGYFLIVLSLILLPFSGYSIEKDSLLCAVKGSNKKPFLGWVKIELKNGSQITGKYVVLNDSIIEVGGTVINLNDIKSVKTERKFTSLLTLAGAVGSGILAIVRVGTDAFMPLLAIAVYFLILLLSFKFLKVKSIEKYEFTLLPFHKALQKPVITALTSFGLFILSALFSIIFDTLQETPLFMFFRFLGFMFLYFGSLYKGFRAVYVAFKYKYSCLTKIAAILLSLLPIATAVAAVIIAINFTVQFPI